MHNHFCKHCQNNFVCPEDAAECFRRFIVCRECFWAVEFKYFLLVFVLGIVAVGLTLFLFLNFRNTKKTGGNDSPVSLFVGAIHGRPPAATENTIKGKYNNETNKAS